MIDVGVVSTTAWMVFSATATAASCGPSSFRPWNRPQSTRIRGPLTSSRFLEPVTVRAAPRNVSDGIGKKAQGLVTAYGLRRHLRENSHLPPVCQKSTVSSARKRPSRTQPISPASAFAV